MTGLPRTDLFFGGEWHGPSRAVATENPSTGATLCEVPDATAAEIDAAVRAARDAAPGWRATPPQKRRDLLLALAAAVREHARDFSRLEATDVGMPVALGKALSAGALRRNLEYHAGWAERLYGDVVPVGEDAFDYTRREPFGVVGAIIPWNTPALFCGGKVGAALACGNTIVLKPSTWGALTPLRFAELVAASGLPAGVVNIVPGGTEAGRALVDHPGVDAISFTGSTETGKAVMEAASRRVAHVHLELGGKSPNIVFADADLGRATGAAAAGCFGLSGQACAAGTRLLVQRAVLAEVTERMAKAAAAWRPADPLDASTLLGPLVTAEHRERVLGAIERAKSEATLVAGGSRVEPSGALAGGNFVEPAVFGDCTNDMEVSRREIFGPVLSVIAFDDEDEAVAIANDTEFGLAAGVWTRDLARAHRVAARLEAGTVWVNAYGTLPNAAPFGGYKGSGFGREGGRESIEEFTRVKNVYVGLR